MGWSEGRGGKGEEGDDGGSDVMAVFVSNYLKPHR